MHTNELVSLQPQIPGLKVRPVPLSCLLTEGDSKLRMACSHPSSILDITLWTSKIL